MPKKYPVEVRLFAVQKKAEGHSWDRVAEMVRENFGLNPPPSRRQMTKWVTKKPLLDVEIKEIEHRLPTIDTCKDKQPTMVDIALAIYDVASMQSGGEIPDREAIKSAAELWDIMETGLQLIMLPKVIEKAVEEKKREWLQWGNYLIQKSFYIRPSRGGGSDA